MLKYEKKKETLSEIISDILVTKPTFDPEDILSEFKTTVPELPLNDEYEEDHMQSSKLRKQNIDLLDDIDRQYVGVKGTRKNLNDSDDWTTEEEIESEDDNSDKNEDDDTTYDEANANSIEEEEDDENEEDENEDEEVSSIEDMEGEGDSYAITSMTDDYRKEQTKKGNSVQNQLNAWESLVEIRIQLQKCLIVGNKMPQQENFKDSESSKKFTSNVTGSKKNLEDVLNKLLDLQLLLIKQYPETKKLFNTKQKPTNIDGEDEEIPSDSENEDISSNDSEELVSNVPKKRRKLSEYEMEIAKKHTMYQPYKDSVIQKWDDKTRIAAVKTNNPSYSTLNQINYRLKEKLKTNDNVNNETYEDNNFYQQLLRELIEVKSSTTNPLALGKFIQLQNMRQKMKKNVDTRATKGRKVRYTVYPKLVNFMSPICDNVFNQSARTELFDSIFQKSN